MLPSLFARRLKNKENNDFITLCVGFTYDVLCAYPMSDSKEYLGKTDESIYVIILRKSKKNIIYSILIATSAKV